MFSMPLFEIVQVSPQNLLDHSDPWVHGLVISISDFCKSELEIHFLVLVEPSICTALLQSQVLIHLDENHSEKCNGVFCLLSLTRF